MNEPIFPAEEDVAPRANADGVTLTFAQKSAILKDAAESKRAERQTAQKILDQKKKAALGIGRAKPASESASSKGEGGSSSRAAGTGVKAALALSPEKNEKKKKKDEPATAAAAGGGVKAALALKDGKGKTSSGGKSNVGVPSGKRSVGKKKALSGGGMIGAAKEAAAKEATTSAEGSAAKASAPASTESEEEREARLLREEAVREAERERRFREREEQRREIELQIVAEERRAREKERLKRERLAAEKKAQKAFREAAFDGELEAVRATIERWRAECFGDFGDGKGLIGHKLDAADEHGHTALSEAACGGQAEVCALLLSHGASVNAVNEQGRTPLWRAAFMDKRACVQLLLQHGGDPRIRSGSHELPATVAPSDEARALLDGWDVGTTDSLLAERAAASARQWQPPPPDPEDAPIGEAGYFLQLGLPRLADAVDSITAEGERPILVVDLGGKALTYFEYSDCNLCCYGRASDVEPPSLRKKLIGALRYGKPLVLDFLSLELERDLLEAAFDAVLPGLLGHLLSRRVLHEEVYTQLIADEDGEEYRPAFFSDKALKHFQFVLVSRLPIPPEWAAEHFFILRVAA